MTVFVQRRLEHELRRNRVSHNGQVIVPMPMGRAAPMPVEVDVPRKHRGLASQRCIKRVVCRREFMLVYVAVVMLGELCVLGMRVTIMLDGNRDFKAVRLRDCLDGFPARPLFCEPEALSSAPLTQRLNRNGVGMHSRKAETRWDARLEDR